MNDATVELLLLAAAPVGAIVSAAWYLGNKISQVSEQITGQMEDLARIEKDRKECELRHERDLACTDRDVEKLDKRVDGINERLFKVEAKVE